MLSVGRAPAVSTGHMVLASTSLALLMQATVRERVPLPQDAEQDAKPNSPSQEPAAESAEVGVRHAHWHVLVAEQERELAGRVSYDINISEKIMNITHVSLGH